MVKRKIKRGNKHLYRVNFFKAVRFINSTKFNQRPMTSINLRKAIIATGLHNIVASLPEVFFGKVPFQHRQSKRR